MRTSLLLVLISIMSGCAFFQKAPVEPKVNLKDVDVTRASLSEATLVFNFLVENPNAFGLSLDQIDYTILLNGKPFTKGLMDQKVNLAANSSAKVPLPIKVKYTDVLTSLTDLVEKKSTQYQIDGKVRVGILSIPYSQKGDIKLSNL